MGKAWGSERAEVWKEIGVTRQAAAKKKRKNKKKGGDKSKPNNDSADANGVQEDHEGDQEDGEGEDDEQEPARNPSVSESAVETKPDAEPSPESANATDEPLPIRNGAEENKEAPEATAGSFEQADSDTSARLDAMAKERDDLRAEVAELRKSLESIRERHEEELNGLREEAEDAQAGKENAESQYRTLLGKVNTIRSQLGERLKADAEELSQARAQIEELQEENRTLQEENRTAQNQGRSLRESHEGLQATIARLTEENKTQADEIASLRNRTNLSQSNWAKERDDLVSQLAYAREEFENAKQAMQDWEVLAMEERSLRENFGDRVGELEEQLSAQREAYEHAASERDSQNSTVDGLQRALQDIQDARKRELREMVENSQAQLDELRKQVEEAKKAAAESAATLETTRKELERALPFEKEVKEKNLLIGKLRHEAVILNDHLTKALRFLKRGKPEDNVDRQIVTNHFLHFLALDRSDPKKFQILQLIAALLGWTDEQREQAGLARPGASNASLRIPMSPFRRTPSTPSLSADFPDTPGGASRESLAELWSDFLAREAEAGGSSRRESAVTSPTNGRNSPGLGLKGVGG
ncbi:hypothetical protein H2203_008444 [Taxawa tesnikishii (nom. ined.)]|nr:hypothetical protein H2203_008444 [Dothideales sp. JES 119]